MLPWKTSVLYEQGVLYYHDLSKKKHLWNIHESMNIPRSEKRTSIGFSIVAFGDANSRLLWLGLH